MNQFYAQAIVCRDPSLALQIRVTTSAESPIADTDSVFIYKWKYLKSIWLEVPNT